jgi:hypothetical protein
MAVPGREAPGGANRGDHRMEIGGKVLWSGSVRTRTYLYYRKYVKGMNNNQPERWAWHAYSDAELTLGYPDPSDWWRKFRSFARRTSYVGTNERSPYIWLTEPGAVREDAGPATRIRRDGRGTEGQRAQLVTNRMTRAVDRGLLGTSSRILRFYYYSMRGDFDSNEKAFDSGLLTQGRDLRGNYYSYRCRVANGPTAGCP